MPRTNAPGMVLEGGTLTSWQATVAAPLVRPLDSHPEDRNVGMTTEDCFGTLLSPEGPGIAPITRTSRRRCCASRVDGAVAVEWDRSTAEPPGPSRQATDEDLSRPYLENCTVDASIFVAKLIRAHGGCLGTRSR